MKIVLLGPPGGGKGTVASKLKDKLGYPHISTGDIFRTAIKNQTELGKKVKGILAAGELVPDELTTDLVRTRLSEPDAKNGYILDGFPRSLAQAQALSGMQCLDHVINFNISHESVISRLTGRRTCKDCGAIFHVTNIKPKKEGVCDYCNSNLVTREDDKEEAVRNRLSVYNEATKPLIDYYKNRGELYDIDAGRPLNETLAELEGLLS